MSADKPRERRATFRQACHQSCPVELSGTLRDLSLGGAALEMPFPIPVGQRLKITVADADIRLDLTGEVVATGPGYFKACVMHLRFVEMPAAIERALQRYLIKLEIHTSVSLKSVDTTQ